MSGSTIKVDAAVVSAVHAIVLDALNEQGVRPVVIGVCGAQGAGKSTLAEAVRRHCEEAGLPTAVLSLDDLYLPLADRLTLARTVHPLLATRGVPGTHEVALGLEVIAALRRGETPRLPRFDKARDDRCPVDEWPSAPEGCRVLLIEGWCLGAGPQDDAALQEPVNALEVQEDAQGIWRRYANDALSREYAELWARLDRLVLLAAPAFDVVEEWRFQQEADLAHSRGSGAGLMDRSGIKRFVAHYERLTRHVLTDVAGRADLVIKLDRDRRPIAITRRS